MITTRTMTDEVYFLPDPDPKVIAERWPTEAKGNPDVFGEWIDDTPPKPVKTPDVNDESIWEKQ